MWMKTKERWTQIGACCIYIRHRDKPVDTGYTHSSEAGQESIGYAVLFHIRLIEAASVVICFSISVFICDKKASFLVF